MKIADVPQDGTSVVSIRKVFYATDDKGDFVKVTSSGWEPGVRIYRNIMEELEDLAAQALARVRSGRSSPLEHLMYKAYYDLDALANAVGLSPRTVRRHFKPRVFRRLDDETLGKYAKALHSDIEAIRQFS